MEYKQHTKIIYSGNKKSKLLFRPGIKGIVLFFSVVIFAVTSQAQQSIKFDHLGMEQGLSESIVLSILQDREGYMWFGTADGLNRYDGNRFTVFHYNALDTNSLSHNYIQVLHEDSHGTIWVGTLGGLNWFDKKHEKFYLVALASSGEIVTKNKVVIRSIIEDRSNTLWIGTGDDGFYKLEIEYKESSDVPLIKKIDHYTDDPANPDDLNGMFACPVLIDSLGKVWICSIEYGISILDPSTGKYTHIKYDPADSRTITTNRLTTVLLDRKKNLWIGTEDKGLNRFIKETGNYKHYLGKGEGGRLSNDVIRGQYEDSEGRMWVATDGGGLLLYHPQGDSFSVIRHDPVKPGSLANDRVMTIYEDRAGTLWFGTWGSGVDRWSPVKNKFKNNEETQHILNSIPSKFIVSIYEDSRNNLWIGMHGGGVISLDRKTGTMENLLYHPLKPKGILSGVVWSIREDQYGNIWFATDKGVDRYIRETGTFTHVDEEQSKGGRLGSRYAGRAEPYGDNVWITTERGLDRINITSGAITNYPYSLGTDDTIQGYVSGMYIDREGMIWLGTTPIKKFDPFSNKYLKQSLNIGSRPVSCIVGDKNNNLWIGTFGDGFYVFDSSRTLLGHYLEQDGLPNNVVYGVLEDDRGNYWLSTNRGISKFNLVNKSFRNYDIDAGLQSNEFNRCAFFRSKTGMMYFGGINGYNAFYPDQITDNPHLPPMMITEFRKFNEPVIFNMPVSQMNEIVLKYDENFFSFEFAALDYVQPSKNLYSYKLEGFDRNWVNSGKNRLANYTNVEPGEYTFRVRGTNNDGVWNEQGTSIRVIIPPPFWKTAWFIWLAAVTGISAFGGTVRFISTQKLKRTIKQLEQEKAIQEERQKTRERIARDLHDDLASTVGSAGFFIESVKQQIPDAPKQAMEFLNRTGMLLTEAEQSMSDIVWSVSPMHDTLESLFARIRLQTAELCKANNIKYEIDMIGGAEQIQLPADVRRNFYLVFKESLSNAVRYSGGEFVKIVARFQNNTLLLEVSDTGKGIPEIDGVRKQTMRGNGLRNMKARAEEIGAGFSIASEKEKGTTVRFEKRII